VGGDIDEIAASIAERDRLDSTREDSPLRAAADAVLVDSSEAAVEDVVDRICAEYARVSGG